MEDKITGVCVDIPQLIGLLNECKKNNTPILIVSGNDENLILEQKFFKELRAGNAIIMTLNVPKDI
jgi:hypothetical protein